MFKKSFKKKIILPTAMILCVLVTVLTIFLSIRFSAFSNSLVDEKLIANISSLESYFDDSTSNSRAAVMSMAQNPDVIRAVRDRDRKEILRLFTPLLDLYRINFYTILDSEGIVLVRVHEPENYGDSLAYQQNIQDAISGKVSTYFEEGTFVKVSVRTGVPVYDTDGALIGVLSSGVRFDSEKTVAELKTYLNSEVTVFLGNTRIYTTILRNGRNIAGTTLDPEIAKIVLEDKLEYFGNANILGETYKAFYKPLLNAHDEAFAAIFLGMPLSKIKRESNSFLLYGIVIGLTGLVVSIVLLFFIVSTISKPINILAYNMGNIANGNFHIDMTTNSEDEIGYLNKSIKKAVDTIQKLLNDVNVMIVEQANGNIDYRLDANSFKGAYKRLADNILELASFGMKDQVTGIPNRRSFDNRLELEWNRAKRETSPISILMIDIDKFKNYNDTFGHQQGDVALQIASNTIKQLIKRSVDFCARWGGEEFAVLLPDTDSSGAVVIAENIRSEIERTIVPCSETTGERITVSIGVCTQIPASDSAVGRFVSTADGALYQAKEKGRNCCVFLTSDETYFCEGKAINTLLYTPHSM